MVERGRETERQREDGRGWVLLLVDLPPGSDEQGASEGGREGGWLLLTVGMPLVNKQGGERESRREV